MIIEACWEFNEKTYNVGSLLADCLIYARALLENVIFILWMRSFSKMLPSVKFAEDKVLICLIFREKNAKIVQL